MNTVILDLIGDYAVNIGSTYTIQVQLCNAPDLQDYTGTCQIKQTASSIDVILTPTIEVLTKDIFKLTIPYGDFTGSIAPGNYVYDVLFSSVNDRFYPVGGKIQLVQRVTSL